MRIAVIGLGVMGGNHLRVLRGMPQVDTVVGCDPAVSTPEGVEGFDSLEALLEAGVPDAAVVAVPTPLHTDICLALIARGVDLLIEKPVAATVDDAARIAAAAEAAGVKTAVGHIERYNPVVQSLKRELADSEIYTIAFTRVGHMPPRIGDVGVLTDLAVHDIDLLRFITGKPVLRTAVYSSRRISNHFEDTASVTMELEGSVLATITTNWLTPFKRRRIEVTTADGYFDVDLIAQELSVYSAYRDDDTYLTRPCGVRKGEPLAGELQAFVTYLQTGERGDLATIADSEFTLRTIRQGTGETA